MFCRFSPLFAIITLVAATNLHAQSDSAPASIQADEIEASLAVNYYGLYMGGNKVGMLYKSLTRTGTEADPTYTDSTKTNLKAKAQDKNFEMQRSATIEFDGSHPYHVRKVRTWLKQGRSLTKIEIDRKQGAVGYVVTVTKDSKTTREEVSTLGYSLADVLAPQIWIRKTPKTGDQITTPVMAGTNKEIRKLAVAREEAAEAAVAFEVEVNIAPQGATSVERYDRQGKLLGGKLDIATEFRIESQNEATTIRTLSDLYAMKSIKIDRPLGDLTTLDHFAVAVIGEGELSVQAGPQQSTVRNAKGTFFLKLGKSNGKPVKATLDDYIQYLKANDFYPIRNPQVVALAKKAVGDAKTPREKVERLVRFVNGYIRYEYNAEITPVMDILSAKKGDCTEYSSLFATLARAVGIPARRVGGLGYAGDKTQTFEPHAWNEVIIDGHWVAVDATNNEVEASPAHVRLTADMDRVSKDDSVLNSVSFKLVQIKRKQEAVAQK